MMSQIQCHLMNVIHELDNPSSFKIHDFQLSAKVDNEMMGKEIITYANFTTANIVCTL